MAQALDTGLGLGASEVEGRQAEMARKREVPSSRTARQRAGVAVPSDALAGVLGQNLKRLRRRQGYSLERLAKQSGVSRAMLGQIETGRSVPTVGLVAKIAAALDVSLPSLLSPPDSPGLTVLRGGETRSVISADGLFVARALFPLGGERRVEFYEVTLAADHVEEDKAHQPGTRESLVVEEGSVEVRVARERPVLLGKGDVLTFAADQSHAYRNVGKEPARFYLVMTFANGEA